jgi:hypothetical protein
MACPAGLCAECPGWRRLKYVHSVTTFSVGGKGRWDRARSTCAIPLPRYCPADPPIRIARACTQFVDWLNRRGSRSKSELTPAARAAAPFVVVMPHNDQHHFRCPRRFPTQTHAELAAAALPQRPEGPPSLEKTGTEIPYPFLGLTPEPVSS